MTTTPSRAASMQIERAQSELLSGSPAAQTALRRLSRWRIDEDAIEYFGLGLDTSHSSAGRLLIPTGSHSFILRALFDEAKCAQCGHETTAAKLSQRKQQHDRLRSGGVYIADGFGAKLSDDAESLATTSAFNHAKRQLPLKQYLTEQQHVDLVEAEQGRHAGRCPFHDDRTPSMFVYEHDGEPDTFHCFGCEANGTVIDAVMLGEHLELPFEAVAWIDANYGEGQLNPAFDWRSCEACMAPANKARIAWLMNQHPKYLNPKDQPPTDTIYRLPSASALASSRTKRIHIGEGYRDAWALHASGLDGACAFASARLSDDAKRALGNLLDAVDGSELVLCPDYDLTGRRMLDEIANWAAERIGAERVRIMRWAPANDYTNGDGGVPSSPARLLQHWGPQAVRQASEHGWTLAEQRLHQQANSVGALVLHPQLAEVALNLALRPERAQQLARTGWMQHVPEMRERIVGLARPARSDAVMPFVDETGMAGLPTLADLLDWTRDLARMDGKAPIPLLVWDTNELQLRLFLDLPRFCHEQHMPLVFVHGPGQGGDGAASFGWDGRILESQDGAIDPRYASGEGVLVGRASTPGEARELLEAMRAQLLTAGLDPAQWQRVVQMSGARVAGRLLGCGMHVEWAGTHVGWRDRDMHHLGRPLNPRTLELLARTLPLLGEHPTDGAFWQMVVSAIAGQRVAEQLAAAQLDDQEI